LIPALRRWRELLLVGSVVVAAHAWLLVGNADAGNPPKDPGAGKAMRVRLIESPPQAPAQSAMPLPPVEQAVLAAAPARTAQRPVKRRISTAATAATAAAAPSATQPVPKDRSAPYEPPTPQDQPAAAEPDMVLVAANTAAAAPAPVADAAEAPPPIYETSLPPSFVLTYDLKRGVMSGVGELRFVRVGQEYTFTMRGTVLSLEVIGMTSRGHVGSTGLVPDRYVDRRRGRDRNAANFDHVQSRITYSGPSVVVALMPGAQDRLSWLAQLPAIVAAAPAKWAAGTRVLMQVSGARGDADVWAFIVHGREEVVTASGPVRHALRLTREPRKPYDTQVEVWLDPARHHLPVRARMTTLPGGDTLELSLSE
jgi:hypothetical protein